MRQVILSVLGLLILFLSVMVARNLMSTQDNKAPVYQPVIPSVYVDTIRTGDIPTQVEVSGTLRAVDRIDLFSEVQGLFVRGDKFKTGARYRKGELMIAIESKREVANLKAQRSTMINQIAGILPDLKFDHADQYQKWADYVTSFDINKKTPPLPEPETEREKLFIASKNISSQYYLIRNLEAHLEKFYIYAPFTGTLTEHTVRPGALVSPGQLLGTYIGANAFELELSVRESFADRLVIGQTLKVFTDKEGVSLTGRLVRINPSVDPNSQAISVFVSLHSPELKEGMFMRASIPLTPVNQAVEIDRKLLIANKYVYVVAEAQLAMKEVTPVFYKEETVVVTGLEDGQLILGRPLPGAREGMEINVLNQ